MTPLNLSLSAIVLGLILTCVITFAYLIIPRKRKVEPQDTELDNYVVEVDSSNQTWEQPPDNLDSIIQFKEVLTPNEIRVMNSKKQWLEVIYFQANSEIKEQFESGETMLLPAGSEMHVRPVPDTSWITFDRIWR